MPHIVFVAPRAPQNLLFQRIIPNRLCGFIFFYCLVFPAWDVVLLSFPEGSSSAERVSPRPPSQAAGPPAGWDQWEAEDHWRAHWVRDHLNYFFLYTQIYYRCDTVCCTFNSSLFSFSSCCFPPPVVTPSWSWSWLRFAPTLSAWRVRTTPRASAWRSSRKCCGVHFLPFDSSVWLKQSLGIEYFMCGRSQVEDFWVPGFVFTIISIRDAQWYRRIIDNGRKRL